MNYTPLAIYKIRWDYKQLFHPLNRQSQFQCPDFLLECCLMFWGTRVRLPGRVYALRIRICPKEGVNPTILLWGWDRDHRTYCREGFGSLGMYWDYKSCAITFMVKLSSMLHGINGNSVAEPLVFPWVQISESKLSHYHQESEENCQHHNHVSSNLWFLETKALELHQRDTHMHAPKLVVLRDATRSHVATVSCICVSSTELHWLFATPIATTGAPVNVLVLVLAPAKTRLDPAIPSANSLCHRTSPLATSMSHAASLWSLSSADLHS